MNSGIPYFPLMCQLDAKWELIEAELGLPGFAIAVKLFQRIYGEQGYYCEWDEEVALLFARRVAADSQLVEQVVQAAIRRGLFHEGVFRAHAVLTSAGIQKWYLGVVRRRKQVEIRPEYLLVPRAELPGNVTLLADRTACPEANRNLDLDLDRDENRRCTSCSGEQADGNRRCTSGSGEQVDGNRRFTSGSGADEGRKGVQIWGEFQQVRLTGEEREKLDRRIGRSEARQLIDRLDRWLAQGNVRRNHYATLLQWADRDAARRPDKPDRPASYDIEEAARTLGGL